MITTDRRDKLGITVAKDLHAVVRGNVTIAGEASCEEDRQLVSGGQRRLSSVRAGEIEMRKRCVPFERMVSAVRARGARLGSTGAQRPWAGRGSFSGAASRGDVRSRVAMVAGGALAGDIIAAAGLRALAAV